MIPQRLPVFVISLALVLLVLCSRHRIAPSLDDVETYLQDRPDSALATLRAIDTTRLSSHALRARYALLYAIALDKNWIDTSDVSVILPASTTTTGTPPAIVVLKPGIIWEESRRTVATFRKPAFLF